MLDIGSNRKQTQSQREKVMTQVLELASRTFKATHKYFQTPPHPPPNIVIMKEQMRNFSRELELLKQNQMEIPEAKSTVTDMKN